MRKNIIICIVLLVLCYHVFAIDCPSAKIKHIQPESNGKILILMEGYSWRNVGHVDSLGVREMYSLILMAYSMGKKISMRYRYLSS